MKKVISFVLILAMTLCLFAGCNNNNNPTEAAGSLADAKAYLQAMYEEKNGTAYTRDFNVVTVVMIDGVSYPVSWAIEVVSGDAGAVEVKDNGNKTATVCILNKKPTEEVRYNLVGTISDAAGNKETVSFNYVIPAVAASGVVFVEQPETGVAYKFAMQQNKLEKTLYFTGEMSDKYLATSANPFEAVDVFVEDVEGGQRMYFMKGDVKTYIDVVLREGETEKCNVVLTAEPTCVYNWDAERGTFVTKLGEVSFYIGAYNTFDTFSVSKFSYIEDVSKIGVDQFPGGLCTVNVGVDFVETPAVDTAYKFAMQQNKLGQTLYFTGEMSGYYLATSVNPGDGVDVFVENVEGGQRMYFMKDDVKTYIDVVLREGETEKCNVVLTAEPTCVYNWDAERGTFVTKLGEVSFYIGAYNTFNTFSVSKFSYIEDVSKIGVDQFPGGLCTVSGIELIPSEPEEPEAPSDPAADTELSVKDAIALGASKGHDKYTEGKYYVTGVITEIYNDTYGNMKIADDEGNILTIYGTWSADGTIRFDALENKPAVGDTVKIYGIIGQYNGTPQIKNGWIIEVSTAVDEA